MDEESNAKLEPKAKVSCVFILGFWLANHKKYLFFFVCEIGIVLPYKETNPWLTYKATPFMLISTPLNFLFDSIKY